MARQVFHYDPPERFVAGTVGEPGARTFFLQAAGNGRLTSVALEKEQVAVLAQRLDALLDEVLRETGGAAAVPALAPVELDDTGPLAQPIVEEFRVGTLTLAWDLEDDRAVIEAYSVSEADDSDDLEPPDPDSPDDDRDVLIVRLTGAMARAFVKRALAVVAAGRPTCPLCGQPLDPDGHLCPRQNGYRRRG